MEEKIKVSVTLLAYKHAKYLRQCLDSILEQEVNFRYEIIIGEDCSNDGSAEILREYRDRYPDIVIPIINEHNLGGTQNSLNVRGICRGEYIAGGESDDFWTDKHRLQKQADFLDNHPEYSGVGTNFYNVDPEGKHPYVSMLRWQVGKAYSMKHFLRYGFVVHGNTLMRRRFPEEETEKYRQLYLVSPTMGDVIFRVITYTHGPIYAMQDITHAHRMGSADPTSFYATQINKALETSYLYCEIVDALESYFGGKLKLGQLKANRTAGMLLGIVCGKYHVDRQKIRVYMKQLPFVIRLLSYERLVQKILRGFFHYVGRKLKLYFA